mmetsp:Transcript_98157/g.189554  ORF Transcript_98157/g.189554 Transcript_98157/m.189554 type:complete len:132 (-) Transcript_98157:35-430(-)
MQNIRCQSVQEVFEIQQLQYLKTVLAAHLANFDATRYSNAGHKSVQQSEWWGMSGTTEGARMVIQGGPAYVMFCQGKEQDILQQNQPKTAKPNPANYHSQSDILPETGGRDTDIDVLVQLKAKLALRLAQF